MNFPTDIGIGNAIKTEFPTGTIIKSVPSPTITGLPCFGTVTRDSDLIIMVETNQVCVAGSFSMVIDTVKNPVPLIYIYIYINIYILFNFF